MLDYDLHIDRSISFLLSPNVIAGKVSVVVSKQDQHQHKLEYNFLSNFEEENS